MAKNEVPTVKLRRTSAGNLRNFFFIFTVIGIASIVIVRMFPANSLLLQMALPGLVVLFYAIFIFNKGRNVLNLDQLGDSVYYLGFILTLAALILALYDLSDDPTCRGHYSKVCNCPNDYCCWNICQSFYVSICCLTRGHK
jgi:hypothetical protein